MELGDVIQGVPVPTPVPSQVKNTSLWYHLARVLSHSQAEMFRCYQDLSSQEQSLFLSPSVDLLSRLQKLSLSAVSLYSQCEALLMSGMIHFGEGKHKASLSLFRSVLDRDPTHLEVLPILAWNCLILGLNTDAQICGQNYRTFHDKNTKPELYNQVCRSSVRHSTLGYLWGCLSGGELEAIRQFENQWVSLNLGNAEFDFEVLFAMADFLRGQSQKAKSRVKTLYHQFPYEWLPALLWSVGAFGEKDLAACDEMITHALKKASQHQQIFIQSVQQAMFSVAL